MKASQSRQGFSYIFKAGDRECTPVGQFFPLPPNHYKCSVHLSVHLSVHVADLVGLLTRDSLLTRTSGINTIFKTANFITMYCMLIKLNGDCTVC